MPRLNNIDPTTGTCAGADLLNGPLKAKQINIYKGLAAHPTLFEAFMAWGKGSKAGGLTPSEGEVVQLLAAEKFHCAYCTAAHTKIASGMGLSDDDCANIRRRTSDDPKTQALINFTAESLDTFGNVSDETLAAFMDAGFNTEAAIEVAAGISIMTFTSYYNHINDTVVDFPEPTTV
ncbi:MAG: carboxymuconolactone decarboxylase family protein [Phycisphaerae bacterium]|jgi:AhpD family alkylhydroperoxidase|nr:carboxymuconolactone decarboxylase family protein [Phycisphaerae bacterium]HJN71475.1 carboxymuconolactone decarboxylase family protein [Phycisphaerales bacterium]|tara:strand:+ start:2565 stop:3095 length:531 start_codon:yes stop_codon:yes gene_type:complete